MFGRLLTSIIYMSLIIHSILPPNPLILSCSNVDAAETNTFLNARTISLIYILILRMSIALTSGYCGGFGLFPQKEIFNKAYNLCL